MRVIAGKAGSIPLKTIESNDTRPTTDRIKETLFNIINFDISNSVFLDLFSGSGGIGIEALSRGAKKAYFVDNNSKCVDIINQNLNKTKLSEMAVVLCGDYSNIFFHIKEHIDFVFIDPPYDFDIEDQILKLLYNCEFVDNNTSIIIESKIEKDFEFINQLGFELVREKNYKSNKHVFIRKDFTKK